MFDKLLLFLENQDWKYHTLENNIVIFTINGENGVFRCIADIQEENKVFIFYSICSISCPIEKLSVVSEFITKLNFNRIFGNFELDYNDGEIRYKTSAYYNEPLEDVLIERIILTNIISLDMVLKDLILLMLSDTKNINALIENQKKIPN